MEAVTEAVAEIAESKTDSGPTAQESAAAIAELRRLGVRFEPNEELKGTDIDFGLIMGPFPSEKLALLQSLPKVFPPVTIRLPEGVTDDGLQHLAGLKNLQSLAILGNNVTDAGLRHLTRLKSLKRVIIWSGRVTPTGLQNLRQALPGCQVEQGQP